MNRENSNTNNTGREIEFPEISDNLTDFLTKDTGKLPSIAEDSTRPTYYKEMEYLPASGLIHFKNKGLVINLRDISCVWTDDEDSNKLHISLRSEYSDILIKIPLEHFTNVMKHV